MEDNDHFRLCAQSAIPRARCGRRGGKRQFTPSFKYAKDIVTAVISGPIRGKDGFLGRDLFVRQRRALLQNCDNATRLADAGYLVGKL
jgi:hypothetical protein